MLYTIVMSYFVYMLECRDGSFYSGVTTDPTRRLAEHNEGKKGAKYTRARLPVRLVYCEQAADRSEAQQREYALRRLSRTDKQALIDKSRIYF